LNKAPVVQDSIASQSVLVVLHRPTGTALAFDPTVAGQVLEFEYVNTTDHDVILRDRQTGTLWSGLTGRAQSEGGGQPQLRQLRTSQFVVSNWPQHFPDAAVFGMP